MHAWPNVAQRQAPLGNVQTPTVSSCVCGRLIAGPHLGQAATFYRLRRAEVCYMILYSLSATSNRYMHALEAHRTSRATTCKM